LTKHDRISAGSSEAFVAPASPALSVSVVARQPAATMLGGGKGKPKKAAKKVRPGPAGGCGIEPPPAQRATPWLGIEHTA